VRTLPHLKHRVFVAVDGTVHSPAWRSLHDQAEFLAPMLPLSANVVYPTMAVVDCRAEGISVGSLFRSFRLVQLNSILCSDLTERECAYNAGTIDETDPEKVALRRLQRALLQH
jgi:hypothetical protein